MNKVLSSALVLVLFLFCANTLLAQDIKLLLFSYTIEGSPSSSIKKEFDTRLEKALETHGFDVQNSNERLTMNDISKMQSLVQEAGAEYGLFGLYTQEEESFAIDSYIVNASSDLIRNQHFEGVDSYALTNIIDSIASQLDFSIKNNNLIMDIQIQGLNYLDSDRVRDQLHTRIGEAPNLKKLDEDLNRVWNMGYFEDIQITLRNNQGGDTLILELVEKPQITDIQIVGSEAVKIKDAMAAIITRENSILNEKILARDLQVLTELYRKKGHYLARITYEVEVNDDLTATLILNVDEGKKLYIKDIVYGDLDKSQIKGVKKYTKLRIHGAFSWFTKSGLLEDATLERDTQGVQAFLVNEGYLQAQVAAPVVDYDEDGIIITYQIDTGILYTLGEVNFKGDLVESAEDLYEKINLDDTDREEAFSLATMQEDIQLLTELYNDYGYAFAEVNVETPMNPTTGIVDINYILTPNEKVYIRNVILEGNNHTRDNVVIRELDLADGQAYNGFLMRDTIQNLYRTSYFEEVLPELLPTGMPGEVDLKLSVKEAHTGSFGFGFGYSTYDKFGVNLSVTENNLFGRGYSLNLQTYASTKELSISSSFYNPRIYNTLLGFSASVYADNEEWLEFDRETIGGRGGLSYPIGKNSSISASYSLEFYELYNVAADASSSIKEYEGENWGSVFSLRFARDTTNDYRFPTAGTKFDLTAEYGGGILGGSEDYIKLYAKYGFYVGLFENHALHFRITGGIAVPNDGATTVPAFERFYLGGIGSLRGFDHEDITPVNPYNPTETIGGTQIVHATVEYLWQVTPEFGLVLVPFFDIGSVVDAEYEQLFNKTYYSVGGELRWASPLGDLRFAYGIPLTKGLHGQDLTFGRFEFSMGKAF